MSKAFSYSSRYPCFEVLSGSESRNVVHRVGSWAAVAFPHWLYDYVFAMIKHQEMVALKKVSEDERRWDWFRSF